MKKIDLNNKLKLLFFFLYIAVIMVICSFYYYFFDYFKSIENELINLSSELKYVNITRTYFIIAMTITGIPFLLILALFSYYFKKHFFWPMINIMNSVENIKTDDLAFISEETDSQEFKNLINKINEMLKRIDEKNNTIIKSQFLLQEAEIKKQNAIIISLKKQINAHFTINVLNIIKILARKGEFAKVNEMCDGLSFLLRYANDGSEFINILEEFNILEKYITIMKIRYKNSFSVEYELDDNLGDFIIPRMLLQPIIENAILHGFKNNTNEHTIMISGKIQNKKIEFKISDNGEGISKIELANIRQTLFDGNDTTSKGIERIALQNIQQRIISYYGNSYGISINSILGKGTVVTIVLGLMA